MSMFGRRRSNDIGCVSKLLIFLMAFAIASSFITSLKEWLNKNSTILLIIFGSLIFIALSYIIIKGLIATQSKRKETNWHKNYLQKQMEENLRLEKIQQPEENYAKEEELRLKKEMEVKKKDEIRLVEEKRLAEETRLKEEIRFKEFKEEKRLKEEIRLQEEQNWKNLEIYLKNILVENKKVIDTFNETAIQKYFSINEYGTEEKDKDGFYHEVERVLEIMLPEAIGTKDPYLKALWQTLFEYVTNNFDEYYLLHKNEIPKVLEQKKHKRK